MGSTGIGIGATGKTGIGAVGSTGTVGVSTSKVGAGITGSTGIGGLSKTGQTGLVSSAGQSSGSGLSSGGSGPSATKKYTYKELEDLVNQVSTCLLPYFQFHHLLDKKTKFKIIFAVTLMIILCYLFCLNYVFKFFPSVSILVLAQSTVHNVLVWFLQC